jgi:hypothetical protein
MIPILVPQNTLKKLFKHFGIDITDTVVVK